MIGHEDPAVQKKSRFLPQFAQNGDEVPAESRASKKAIATISAGRDELQLARLELAPIDRHKTNIGGNEQSRESQSWLALRRPAKVTFLNGLIRHFSHNKKSFVKP